MIIDCVSDLHGHYPDLEGGDVLIIAGDITASDKPYQYIQFFIWLDKQKYKHRILIAGNHDNVFKDYPPTYGTWHYLCDSGIEIEGVKFWGSPWTNKFPGMNEHCKAFAVDTQKELAVHWAKIPEDTNILVTHSPPFGTLDKTIHDNLVGPISLSQKLWCLQNLKLHVFGHIHESYGKIDASPYAPNYVDMYRDPHCSVNASHVNEHYQPVNPPIRIIL